MFCIMLIFSASTACVISICIVLYRRKNSYRRKNITKVLQKVANENVKSNINRENDKPNASNSIQTKSPDIGIKQNDWDREIKIQLILLRMNSYVVRIGKVESLSPNKKRMHPHVVLNTFVNAPSFSPCHFFECTLMLSLPILRLHPYMVLFVSPNVPSSSPARYCRNLKWYVNFTWFLSFTQIWSHWDRISGGGLDESAFLTLIRTTWECNS